MMHSSWPSSTVSPCLTSTFHMFPCSGEGSVSGPPAARRLALLRLGAVRRRPRAEPFDAGEPPPPANGRPDDPHVEALARDLDRVASARPSPRPRRPSPGGAGAGKASVFSHCLSSIRSRQVSPRPTARSPSSALWKGISVFRPSISYSSSARSMRLRGLLAVGVPDDQLGDHRVVHRRDLAARARRPSRRARRGRRARGRRRSCPAPGRSSSMRPRR